MSLKFHQSIQEININLSNLSAGSVLDEVWTSNDMRTDLQEQSVETEPNSWFQSGFLQFTVLRRAF